MSNGNRIDDRWNIAISFGPTVQMRRRPKRRMRTRMKKWTIRYRKAKEDGWYLLHKPARKTSTRRGKYQLKASSCVAKLQFVMCRPPCLAHFIGFASNKKHVNQPYAAAVVVTILTINSICIMCNHLRDIRTRSMHNLDLNHKNMPNSNVNMSVRRESSIFLFLNNSNVCLIK